MVCISSITVHVSICIRLSVLAQIVECLLLHVLDVDHEYPLEWLCAIAHAVGAREGLNVFEY